MWYAAPNARAGPRLQRQESSWTCLVSTDGLQVLDLPIIFHSIAFAHLPNLIGDRPLWGRFVHGPCQGSGGMTLSLLTREGERFDVLAQLRELDAGGGGGEAGNGPVADWFVAVKSRQSRDEADCRASPRHQEERGGQPYRATPGPPRESACGPPPATADLIPILNGNDNNFLSS